jgi:hypothetical protein
VIEGLGRTWVDFLEDGFRAQLTVGPKDVAWLVPQDARELAARLLRWADKQEAQKRATAEGMRWP